MEESVSNRAFAGLSAFNRLNVTGPGYVEVAVAADIVLDDLRQASQVKRQVTDALDKFLHPLTGGPSADGWELGRNVFASEIASVIQAVPGVDYLKSLQLIPSQAQHRIELASSFVCPVNLPEGSSIRSTDGRKAALLAEPVPAGTEVRFLAVKGFKVGDRIIQLLADGVFSPPLTINSVSVDRESSTQLIGIEPCEFEPPAIGTCIATPDHRHQAPRFSHRPGIIFALTSAIFDPGRLQSAGVPVQILLPDESPAPNLPLLEIQKDVCKPPTFISAASPSRVPGSIASPSAPPPRVWPPHNHASSNPQSR